ncbi:immunity 26/phosphotriesterase HocA family protein [Arthrobacter sp. AD-310]
MSKRPAYGEGDWFCVPLRTGGFGLGLIARATSSGILLGYFFGPRTWRQPNEDSFRGLTKTDAVLVARFGDLSLKQGEWLIIGKDTKWDRGEWPVPIFTRSEQLSGRTYQVFYGENELARPAEERLLADASTDSPPDLLYGAGAVEKALTRLLS